MIDIVLKEADARLAPDGQRERDDFLGFRVDRTGKTQQNQDRVFQARPSGCSESMHR
ncbi:hypothetical protein [Bradyrhizobium sp. URHC0002]